MSFPIRVYLHLFFLDMTIGAVLSLVGFIAPDDYARWIPSPLVVAESIAFLLASVAFAIYVWLGKHERRLAAFPAFVISVEIVLFAVFYFSMTRQPLVGATHSSVQLLALQAPAFLSTALVSSLAGIALWAWLGGDRRSSGGEAVPDRLRHLRDARRTAVESRH